MKLTLLPVALFGFSLALVAAEFSGTWDGEFEGPEGKLKVTYDIKSAGNGWAGSVTAGEWGTFAMSKLKTDSDVIAFTVASDGGSWSHTGTLRAETLSVVISGSEGTMPPVIMHRRAAAVDGKWHGTLETSDGDLKLVFSFHNEAGNVSGAVESELGTHPFLTGSITGQQVTWETDYQGMIVHYVGQVTGDTMQVAIRSPEWEFSLPLTRR